MAQELHSHAAHAQALGRFIDASPSPFHVVGSAQEMLVKAGFVAAAGGASQAGSGKYYSVRDGSIIAWIVPDNASASTPFRITGAHTDSPNLRLKPEPNADAVGYRRLGVEVYGGVLLNSWLDRDLGLSGRLAIRSGQSVESVLLTIDEPLLRIPQLAIHLDRDLGDKGLLLNPQQHLGPIFGLAESSGEIWEAIAGAARVSRSDIVGADLMLHDTQRAQLIGLNEEFISAPRLDNQLSCHAAITALAGTTPNNVIPMVALFDHEEVGSVSATGAATSALPRLLTTISSQLGASPAEFAVASAASLFVSADNAHATHPNYPERHDPAHHIAMNAGPVLKHNANQRYTTDAMSEGAFRLAAERAGVSTQEFVSRTDMGCGSTIGPTVSASLGVRALDVGCPQLAMHSCRELAGTNDPWDMTLLLAELMS
ncbi:MAG: aspartyl aminopeptidase [Verrucomicrobiales bacterium]|jgi:aspartyl aminopeptidase